MSNELKPRLTRVEAEKLCRKVISPHLGESLPSNLFKESVELLLEEVNGLEEREIH